MLVNKFLKKPGKGGDDDDPLNSAAYSNVPGYAFQTGAGVNKLKEIPQEQLITEYQSGNPKQLATSPETK